MDEKTFLQSLTPPSGINRERFLDLVKKTAVETLPAGKMLFKQGDRDRRTCYLLSGDVTLVNDKGVQAKVSGGSEQARSPLANYQPRQFTAATATDCRVLRIDSDVLDIMLTWDQMSGIEVNEISPEDRDSQNDMDWMTRILQSRAFLQVPPANIQSMFMRIQEFPVTAGQVVVKQGDDGDYYYIIKSGKAKVTRSSKTGAELPLAKLAAGDAFGEEALISESKRNATVTMATNGMLMRLSKADFNALLKEPMLTALSYDEAMEKAKQGGVWLDVRLESEHAQDAIPGSINLPLYMIRLKIDTLDPKKPYIVYCDTGRRSSAAAFLLTERGLRVYVLRGGLQGSAPR